MDDEEILQYQYLGTLHSQNIHTHNGCNGKPEASTLLMQTRNDENIRKISDSIPWGKVG